MPGRQQTHTHVMSWRMNPLMSVPFTLTLWKRGQECQTQHFPATIDKIKPSRNTQVCVKRSAAYPGHGLGKMSDWKQDQVSDSSGTCSKGGNEFYSSVFANAKFTPVWNLVPMIISLNKAMELNGVGQVKTLEINHPFSPITTFKILSQVSGNME